MTTKSSADACFAIPEIIQRVAACIDKWDKRTLTYLSRTNRCAYVSLEEERTRNISCRVENASLLAKYMDQRILQGDTLLCRSLEIIGRRGFHSDSREVDAHSSLASILNHLGENQRLEAFAYRASDQSQDFVCVPSQIWNALGASSGTLKSLHIMSHPCNWISLHAIHFTELRSLQLAINFTSSPSECRNNINSPADVFLKNHMSRWLRGMQHLTNLVLLLSKAVTANVRNLLLPELTAIDISSRNSPVGLALFIERHPKLLHVHFCFERPSPVPDGGFRAQDLPNLRALKLRVGSVERSIFDAFFTTPDRFPNNSAEIRAHHPQLEHLSVSDFYGLTNFHYRIHPFERQLRRLDLQVQSSENGQLPDGDLSIPLKPFTKLVELSITLGGLHPRAEFGSRRAIEKAVAELRNLLRVLRNCTLLKALHFCNPSTQPLSNVELKNLRPLPPSLQYISWGNGFQTTTFHIIHDATSQSAHAEICEVPPTPRDMVYDWTAENTIQHVFDL
ncbi:hypothetical protein SCHPADRAFT_931093 [Schizopora paradoxa]|uniref:F-box domain-containing protein n=1 Tax=Schizopora paradoxa TaxID=27342 RepID=A0A0H2RXM7_9AGAM|nr:hypothetical protein SCHPADRAFT_931093 [Schizopora paradoxa]